MPLHDHPEMFVLTKILFGSATSVSLTLPLQKLTIQQSYPLHLARSEKQRTIKDFTIVQSQISSGDLYYLEPHKNNLHTIRAHSNLAFLDLFIPHYDFRTRFANFYKVLDEKTLLIGEMPEDYETFEVKLDKKS